MFRLSFQTILGLAALCAASPCALAQTFLSGPLSDATTGPLTAGVYVTNGAISVPVGATLTIGPGAILKFKNGHYFAVDGSLLVNGAAGNEVVFTDWRDDSIGGDTNGDGSSSGVPGWWFGVQFGASADASSLHHFEVRYAGYGGYGGLRLTDCDASIGNGLIRDGAAAGIDLLSSNSHPQIADCVLQNNGGRALDRVRADALPGFSNNTAVGNGFDQVRVTVGALASSCTLAPENGIGGAFYFENALLVPSGLALTIDAGAVLKFANGTHTTVDGVLTVNGTAGSKVIFTDYRDDSAGGDTNAGGATAGAASWWYGLILNDGADASTLTHFEVRYAGYGGYAGVRLNSCDATLQNGLMRNGSAAGIDLTASSFPTVSSCTLQNNGGRAIDNARLDAVVGFTANTATGNGFNQLRVTQATLAASRTIAKTNCIGSTLYLESSIVVGAGLNLTFQRGVVLKFGNGRFAQIAGSLNTQGISGDPVVFTDYRDDTIGGDTNAGGSTVGGAGWWYGLIFDATSDASALDFFEIRYAGYGGYAGVEISDSDLRLTRGVIRNGSAAGIDLNGTAAKPLINRCSIQNNGQSAITGASVAATPFITRNFAAGNGADQLLVTSASVTSDLYIDGSAGVNDAIVFSANLVVGVGAKLTLGPGAAFKFHNGRFFQVDGALELLGTVGAPVVLTDLRDDSVGGDSNGDGASVGGASWWYGLILGSGAAPSSVEHLRVRYAGYGGYGGVRCESSVATLDHVRSEHCGAYGFQLYAAARARHLAAYSCVNGVDAIGGSFDIEHATVYGGTRGFHRSAAYAGSVVDSIAWNSTIKFDNFPTGQVRYSCGFVGGVGTIDVDPLFVDAASGDLTLQAGSPCIAAGDPFALLDDDCTRSDMGAYPLLNASKPELYCLGKSNSAGCTPFLGFYGHPSASSPEPFTVRAFNLVNNKNGLFFYGFNGRASGTFQGGLKCVADPVRRLPIQLSGGSVGVTDCSGIFTFDFNAHIQSGVDSLLVQGATVNVQSWYRDPGVPSNTGLSNGLEFDVCQ